MLLLLDFRRLMVLIVGPTLALTSACGAAVITVDPGGSADFTAIQPAIDAAEDGDVVLVQPGEYVITESIDFNRLHDPQDPASPPVKNLVVRSEGGPDVTVIRMSETPASPDRASVVIFENDETSASELEGFELTGGDARAVWPQRAGGGVACVGDSSPKLTDCRISGNRGGGAFCTENASPTLTRCAIDRNVGEEGGGLLCMASSSPTLIGCIISSNRGDDGGGLCCFADSSPTLIDCTIAGNYADEESGGGVCCLDDSSPTFVNCSIIGNAADEDGGGLFLGQETVVSLTNCTIAGNTAGFGGAVVDRPGTSPVFTNCVVWGNHPDSLSADNPFARVEHSCVESDSPWPGAGNINEDPIFVRDGVFDFGRFRPSGAPDFIVDPGDYRLQSGSPCIDTGTPIGAPTTDIEGDPRLCGDGVDMGAHEHQTDGCNEVSFQRGDGNVDGLVDVSDVVATLVALFLGQGEITCQDASDSNDDGLVDIADAVTTLMHLFLGTVAIPLPGPGSCGIDPSADGLDCESYSGCG